MLCSNCGTDSTSKSVFCATCGFPVTQVPLSSSLIDRLQPKTARLLCYSLWWVSGIAFLFLKKSDKIIRFNAWQSIITFGIFSLIILSFNLLPPISSIFVYSLAAIVYWVIVTLSAMLWVFLMFTNYRGQMFMLPVVGNLTQKILEWNHPGYFTLERIRYAGARSPGNDPGVIPLFDRQHSRHTADQCFPDHTAAVLASDITGGRKPAGVVSSSCALITDTSQFGSGKLKIALDGAIKAVACTTELRDAYTAAHQQRVARLALGIAQEMGLSQEQIEAVYMAASIHDVGKIRIPAEILSKPGSLTGEELNIVKSHCQAGYDILKTIEFPFPIAQMVLQHHERMNGSGYPSGISGDDILLEARILSVADVVEAMATHRPYRPSLGEQSALAEIKKNRGILYDSEVVDACVKVVAERGLPSFQ